MKLLSDFDGVWTYPDAEGTAHGEALDTALVELAPEPERVQVRAWIASARRAPPTMRKRSTKMNYKLLHN